MCKHDASKLRGTARFGLAMLSAIAGSAVDAFAADWKPLLLTPSSGYFAPAEPIQIDLPTLSTDVIQHLALELDDVDVSSLVALTGNRVSVTPPRPLNFGPHAMRLLEYTADGGIVERGVWSLDVRKSAHFREGDLRANVNLTASNRIADKNLSNQPKPTQGNGSAQVQGMVGNDGWKVSGNASMMFNSIANQPPAQTNQTGQPVRPVQNRHFDLASFLVTGSAGPLSVNAGQQSVAPDSLVTQGFNRRGISATLAAPDIGAAVSAFGVHGQDIAGTQQGLGVSDNKNRIDGATATVRPVAADRDALVVSGTYVSGQMPNQWGVASNGYANTGSTGGHAGSLSADANLFEKRLRLRGEVAHSQYDFDGIDTGEPAQGDHAYTALAQVTPWHNKLVYSQPLVVDFGVTNSRIGTFFRSPANAMGISDRKGTRGFCSLQWYGLNAQFALGRETDNVDDLDILPRTATTLSNLALSYTPVPPLGPNGQYVPPLLGQPTYGLVYNDTEQRVDKASTTLAAGPLSRNRDFKLNASFTYPTWNWLVSQEVALNDDLTHVNPDTRTDTSNLQASVLIAGALTLGPNAQVIRTVNKADASLDSDTTTAGVKLDYVFSQRLTSNLTYTSNRQHVRDGSTDVRSVDVTAALRWVAVPPQGMKPGLTLSIDGSHHTADDRVTAINNANNYQIFFHMAFSWSPAY